MAGNSNSGGKNRKTAAAHVLAGTFRRDRHERRALPLGEGVPQMPSDLPPLGKSLWLRIVPHVIASGAVDIDSVMLGDACRWYAVYRDSLDARDFTLAAKAFKIVDSVGRRYGLTLADRTALDPVDAGMTDRESANFGT